MSRKFWACLFMGLMGSSLSACGLNKPQPSAAAKPMSIQIYQKWELQRGDRVHNRPIVSALGDLAIETNGEPTYAPMNGETKRDKTGCVLFAGAELPGYLFRFCGLTTAKVGTLRKGQVMGTADLLVFATFRKQSNGTWAFVEPSKATIEQILKRS